MSDPAKVNALIQQLINIIDPEGAGPMFSWFMARAVVRRWAQGEMRQDAPRLTDHQCDQIMAALETYEWNGFTRDDIRLIAGTIWTCRDTATPHEADDAPDVPTAFRDSSYCPSTTDAAALDAALAVSARRIDPCGTCGGTKQVLGDFGNFLPTLGPCPNCSVQPTEPKPAQKCNHDMECSEKTLRFRIDLGNVWECAVCRARWGFPHLSAPPPAEPDEGQKASGPPFTVDHYGSFADCVIAEGDWLRARIEDATDQIGQYNEIIAGLSSRIAHMEQVLLDAQLLLQRHADATDGEIISAGIERLVVRIANLERQFALKAEESSAHADQALQLQAQVDLRNRCKCNCVNESGGCLLESFTASLLLRDKRIADFQSQLDLRDKQLSERLQELEEAKEFIARHLSTRSDNERDIASVVRHLRIGDSDGQDHDAAADEIERLLQEIEKYKVWAASCAPTVACEHGNFIFCAVCDQQDDLEGRN